jgi:hypothetical protein
MAMGISDGKSPLTQQQKILAAYSEILKQTSDAQGDYGRTSGGLANGQRTLSKLWENAQITIGEGIYPTMTKLVKFLNSPDGQKVITDFAEAFAEAIKMMAKYLPGVVREVSKLVKKVGQQGLMAGLLSDPKVAIAAAAFAAGSIAGGPGAGAIAAIAAYAGAKGIQDIKSGKSNPNINNLMPALKGLQQSNQEQFGVDGMSIGGFTPTKAKSSKFFNTAAYQPKTNNTFNIWVSNAADSRDSARAIERTLKKITLNGGSLVGVNDNR